MSNGQWITLLDLELGFARGVWPGHQTSALVFSPNGDQLFSAGGQPFVTRWNTDVPTLTGRGPIHEIAAGPLYALAPNKSLCLLSKGESGLPCAIPMRVGSTVPSS